MSDEAVKVMCSTLSMSALPKLRELGLASNEIGDAGITSLASALGSGVLLFPKLNTLRLPENKIGNVGITALATAVENGALPKCTYIDATGNPGDSAPIGNALRAEMRENKLRLIEMMSDEDATCAFG